MGSIDFDVTYCQIDSVDLKLDIYYPDSGGPWPALLFVHGGGWMEGDKKPMPIVPTQAGYLVVSINYRMYPDYRFPAMIEDVKCAIRFLRAHASEYNLDSEHIALVGHSAGAHLAALAGLTDERAGWDVGLYLHQNSRVQAVIAMSGPSDLTMEFPATVQELKENVFGVQQFVSGSPVSYASPDAPPFLIVHGERDEAVPVEQARRLHESLLAAGASSQLLIMQNAGHGLEPLSGTVTPSIEETFGIVLAFLEDNLRN